MLPLSDSSLIDAGLAVSSSYSVPYGVLVPVSLPREIIAPFTVLALTDGGIRPQCLP